MTFVKKYKKVIVAALGVILLIGSDVFGLNLPFTADTIYQAVIGIATAVGVWGVANEG